MDRSGPEQRCIDQMTMFMGRPHLKDTRPFQAVVDAPGFSIGIRCSEETIFRLEYLSRQPAITPTNRLADRAAGQIGAYLADPAFRFDLPLRSTGTDFQQRVWQAIARIPCRQIRTYGELAKLIGSAPRAVGQACGANRYPLIIPCHRVTGANGALGGFARRRDGFLPDIKRWLLEHEGISFITG